MTSYLPIRDVFQLANDDPFLSIAKFSTAAMLNSLVTSPVNGVYSSFNGTSGNSRLQTTEALCSDQLFLKDPTKVRRGSRFQHII
jgi:hypothetical protein